MKKRSIVVIHKLRHLNYNNNKKTFKSQKRYRHFYNLLYNIFYFYY